MVNQALIEVVKNQLGGGVSEDEVREFLRRRGTNEEEIAEIFASIVPRAYTPGKIIATEVKPEVPVQQAPVSSGPSPEIASTTSAAHGVVRDIPPLVPSTPFSVRSGAKTPKTIPSTSSPVSVPVAGRKRRIVLWATPIVAILLLAGGAYAYSLYFASPEKVLDRMASNVLSTRAALFSGTMTIAADGGTTLFSAASSTPNIFASLFLPQEPVTASITFSGSIDGFDTANPALSSTWEISMDHWRMGDFSINGEYRNLERKNYIKLNTLPEFGFLDLTFLKGQWYAMDDSDARAQLGLAGDATDPILPVMTATQRDQLFTAWQADRFLTVNEVLPNETVDGVSAHHYALTFNKDAFKAWLIKKQAIMQGASIDEASLDRELSLITIHTVDIWIGTWDALPRKVTFKSSVQSGINPAEHFEIEATVSGSAYGQPSGPAVPDGSKPIDEALQGIFGQLLGPGGSTAPVPQTLKARNDQRRKDVTAIADAIKKNIAEHGGSFSCVAGPLPTTPTFLGILGAGVNVYPIDPCLVPDYLQRMPKDPTKGALGMSGYSVFYDPKTNKVTVRAPYAEGGTKISITK